VDLIKKDIPFQVDAYNVKAGWQQPIIMRTKANTPTLTKAGLETVLMNPITQGGYKPLRVFETPLFTKNGSDYRILDKFSSTETKAKFTKKSPIDGKTSIVEINGNEQKVYAPISRSTATSLVDLGSWKTNIKSIHSQTKKKGVDLKHIQNKLREGLDFIDRSSFYATYHFDDFINTNEKLTDISMKNRNISEEMKLLETDYKNIHTQMDGIKRVYKASKL